MRKDLLNREKRKEALVEGKEEPEGLRITAPRENTKRRKPLHAKTNPSYHNPLKE